MLLLWTFASLVLLRSECTQPHVTVNASLFRFFSFFFLFAFSDRHLHWFLLHENKQETLTQSAVLQCPRAPAGVFPRVGNEGSKGRKSPSGGSAQTLNYMCAKAIKTEISG